jgi:single-strand DNA-binding protein
MSGSRSRTAAEISPGALNQVHMIGRVSAAPTVRSLPSGDELMSWRLIVERVASLALPDGRRSPIVDTIDCVARERGIQRLASRWASGDVVEVQGSLRRRFWRGAHGVTSRCEVEVSEARRLRAPAAGN